MQTLNEILERVEVKMRDYERYHFAQTENNALLTFFDLAQEFDDIEDFYHLCVAIPKGFFGLDARLYLIEPKSNALLLRAKTEDQGCELNTPPPDIFQPRESPYYTGEGCLVLTIRGKKLLIDQLAFQTTDDMLGLLEVYPMRAQSYRRRWSCHRCRYLARTF